LMAKQLFNTLAAVCIASAVVAAGCGVQDTPAVKYWQLADGESVVILVENTSISLPARQPESEIERVVEFIRSTLNSVLEGMSR
jgi:hypothetical protein